MECGGESVAAKVLHNVAWSHFAPMLLKYGCLSVFLKICTEYINKGFDINALLDINNFKTQFKNHLHESHVILAAYSEEYSIEVKASFISFVMENRILLNLLELLESTPVPAKQLLRDLCLARDSIIKVLSREITAMGNSLILTALTPGANSNEIGIESFCKILEELLDLSPLNIVVAGEAVISTLITLCQHSSKLSVIFDLLVMVYKLPMEKEPLSSSQIIWTRSRLEAVGKTAITTKCWIKYMKVLEQLTSCHSTPRFETTLAHYLIGILCEDQESVERNSTTVLLSKMLKGSVGYKVLDVALPTLAQSMSIPLLEILQSYISEGTLDYSTLGHLKSNLSNQLFAPAILIILKKVDPILLIDTLPQILELVLVNTCRENAIELLKAIKIGFSSQFEHEIQVVKQDLHSKYQLIGQQALLAYSIDSVLKPTAGS